MRESFLYNPMQYALKGKLHFSDAFFFAELGVEQSNGTEQIKHLLRMQFFSQISVMDALLDVAQYLLPYFGILPFNGFLYAWIFHENFGEEGRKQFAVGANQLFQCVHIAVVSLQDLMQDCINPFAMPQDNLLHQFFFGIDDSV